MKIITIPQVDGLRIAALSLSDAVTVYHDRAMIDFVDTFACLDVAGDGRAEWIKPARCRDTRDGRDAIRNFLVVTGISGQTRIAS